MDQRPLFSVVIPTYKRPHYLHDAIYSVLNQDFQDLECVVSDNCNGPDTQVVIDRFRSDKRLRVVRPEQQLSMPDHWEFASGHAEGSWVLLLADRKVIYRSGLSRLKRALDSNPGIDVGAFAVTSYDDRLRRMRWSPPVGKTRVIRTSELVNAFLHKVYQSDDDLWSPKSVNGFYSRELALEVRARHGHYFNLPGTCSPDYCSFFINAAVREASLYVGEEIMLAQGEYESNGRISGSGAVKAYLATLPQRDHYRYVPVKAPFVVNLLMNDFLTIRHAVGGLLSSQSQDSLSYYTSLLRELESKRRRAAVSDDEIQFFERALKEAMRAELNAEQQQLAEEAALRLTAQTTPKAGAPALLRNRIRVSLEKTGVRLPRWMSRAARERFANALLASGFIDYESVAQ
jgi:glycosyltransferase involved in cell wall biosynthesis